MFETQNVKGVRKLFGDPNTAECPLFVLTFPGPIPRALKFIKYHHSSVPNIVKFLSETSFLIKSRSSLQRHQDRRFGDMPTQRK